MRTLVLGAGAVGGYFGGRLAEAGRDVTFLVRPPRARVLAERGLVVESPLGNFAVKVKTATADTLAGAYDLVILTAKHYDLDGAIAAIRPAVGPGTAVLPLLNGLLHLDRLDAALGAEQVLGGVAYVGAVLTPQGGIRHHNQLSGIAFGERSGALSGRVRAIAGDFAGTKVDAPGSDAILRDMWEKFVMISVMAGMNCLMRGTVGNIAATRDGAALIRRLLEECAGVAAAAGFTPREDYLARIAAMLTEPGSVNSASMRADLDAGKQTEADAVLGDMRRRAAGFDLDTPLLAASYCHLQVYEARRTSA